MIIARTQVKEVVKSTGVTSMSEDFLDRLDDKVKETIEKACQRAKENTRKTVMGRDV